MNITHVVRGDDHLTNTPRQVPIFQALGFPVPRFGHLPMILGSDKTRLSKRHGATSIMAYKDMGYLPDAMVNYLVRLGWSHGDQELFTRQELIEKFSLEECSNVRGRVQSRQATMGECRIHQDQSAERGGPGTGATLGADRIEDQVQAVSEEWLAQLVVFVKERAKTLVEMVDWVRPYFGQAVTLEEEAAKKFLTPAVAPVLAKLARPLRGLSRLFKTAMGRGFKAAGGRRGDEDGAAGSAGPRCPDRSYGQSWPLRSDGDSRARTNAAATSTRDRAG